MAKADKKTEKKAPTVHPDAADMPEGFVPLGRSRVAGFFIRETGNSIQGFLKDAFVVKSKNKRFPDRKVYVIDITDGETRVMTSEGEETTLTEGLVGIDETGYLKKLSDLEKDREVFLKCKGKESADQQAPWVFAVGVMPF